MQPIADLHVGEAAYRRADFATALANFKPLAAQGNVAAQSALGLMYLHGEGITRDDKEALHWLSEAATAGDMKAASNLGYLYLRGDGVAKDYSRAYLWLSKAAAQGSFSAESNLGMLYRQGWGVPANDVLASHWLSLAAAQGVPYAEADLADIYRESKTVPKDLVVAYALCDDAARQTGAHSSNAASLRHDRNLIGQQMTAAQMQTAAALSRLIQQVGVQMALEVIDSGNSAQDDDACLSGSTGLACRRSKVDKALQEIDRANGKAPANPLQSTYSAAVRRAITQQWLRPSQIPATTCVVHIRQELGGRVTGADLDGACPYNADAKRSVENAVWRTQKLPYLGFENIIRHNLDFTFVPLP